MAIVGTKNLKSKLNSDRRIAESVSRSAHIPAGSTKEQTAKEIKDILGIQGDAVGTLNVQELHSKTLNGGFF